MGSDCGGTVERWNVPVGLGLREFTLDERGSTRQDGHEGGQTLASRHLMGGNTVEAEWVS